MITRLHFSLALGVLAVGFPMSAQLPASAQSANDQLNDLTFRLTKAHTEYDGAMKRLSVVQERYKAGLTTQSEVDDAQTKADIATQEVKKLTSDRAEAERRASFLRPVSIHLDRASVRTAAAAISKATGIPVTVDSGVSDQEAGPVLTLDAQAVPLGTVLEAIAEKADLMIAPQGAGVDLKRWPHLNDRVYRSTTAPWSSDWGVPPTVIGQFGSLGGIYNPFGAPIGQSNNGAGTNSSHGGGFGNAAQGAAGHNQGAAGSEGGQDGFGGFGGFGGSGSVPNNPSGASSAGGFGGGAFRGAVAASDRQFSMTSIGDHLIAIAEPGVGPGGEAGVWMTAYMFDSSGFHRMGRGFHAFSSRASAPGPTPNRNQRPRSGQGARTPGSSAPSLGGGGGFGG